MASSSSNDGQGPSAIAPLTQLYVSGETVAPSQKEIPNVLDVIYQNKERSETELIALCLLVYSTDAGRLVSDSYVRPSELADEDWASALQRLAETRLVLVFKDKGNRNWLEFPPPAEGPGCTSVADSIVEWTIQSANELHKRIFPDAVSLAVAGRRPDKKHRLQPDDGDVSDFPTYGTVCRLARLWDILYGKTDVARDYRRWYDSGATLDLAFQVMKEVLMTEASTLWESYHGRHVVSEVDQRSGRDLAEWVIKVTDIVGKDEQNVPDLRTRLGLGPEQMRVFVENTGNVKGQAQRFLST